MPPKCRGPSGSFLCRLSSAREGCKTTTKFSTAASRGCSPRTEELWGKLWVFHAQCVRGMCRANRWHTRKYKISTRVLLDRQWLESVDTYVARRQLGWPGEACRMDWERLPRKLLSYWVGGGVRGGVGWHTGRHRQLFKSVNSAYGPKLTLVRRPSRKL
jgi:hypothetical protein